MRRRKTLPLIVGAASGWPFLALAQRSKMPLVGFLGGASPSAYRPQLEGMRLGLKDHGYVEGESIAIEYRWADGRYDRLPALAEALVRLEVELIITHGTPAALAAKRATSTIPIVMALVGNPVESGLVDSLSRPGGNLTGSSFFDAELNAKRLELIKILLPTHRRAGVLVNPGNPTTVPLLVAMEESAKTLGLELTAFHGRNQPEIDAALDHAKAQVESLTVHDDGFMIANATRIARRALEVRMPTIGFRQVCQAGGLLAYGVHYPEIWRRSMTYVSKILDGAKPADLPIERATRFELMVNQKTARAFGIGIPAALLAIADEITD